jgi:uncharacterized protein YgiM (DUF1202 family)
MSFCHQIWYDNEKGGKNMKYIACLFTAVLLLLCVACKQQTPAVSTDNQTAVTTTKTTAPLPKEGWITADSMRVRGGVGLTSEIIGGITFGEKVEILGKEGDWYKIRFGDGVGYISGQYLTFTAPTT